MPFSNLETILMNTQILGVLASPDESFKYVGEWEDDYMQGRGVFTDPMGSFEGEWKNGKVTGV
jgi:hypothetical protein